MASEDEGSRNYRRLADSDNDDGLTHRLDQRARHVQSQSFYSEGSDGEGMQRRLKAPTRARHASTNARVDLSLPPRL